LSLKENAEQKTDLERTDSMTKPKKSLKHDFSFVNWGEDTERWFKEVKKRVTTLFPDVSKQASIELFTLPHVFQVGLPGIQVEYPESMWTFGYSKDY